MLSKILQEIGLDNNEATVYLTCLKLGTQNVKTIAQEAGISPYTTAVVLSRLLNRGFVSKIASRKDYYTAESPNIILKIMENNRFKLDESIRVFQNALPQIEAYANPVFIKPEISFYEGKDGIVAAYEDTLTSKTNILSIASIDDIEFFFPKYFPQYFQRRKTSGILTKAIFPDTKPARLRQLKDKEELRTSRLVSPKFLEFHIEMNIYDDKVAYFSIREEIAVIVKSKIIADSMGNMFDLCWKMASIYQENSRLQNKKKKN